MQIQLKKIKLNEIAYPALIAALVLIIVILFAAAVAFLSGQLNKIFAIPGGMDNEQTARIDMGKLDFVERRLGIAETGAASQPAPANNEPAGAATTTAAAEPETTAATTTATAETIPAAADKASLKISILNATGIPGLARQLKDHLETQGFTVASTGNASTTQETTTVSIKDSAKNYGSLLKEAVLAKYPAGDIQPLEENNPFDAVVIIGKK